MSNDRYLRMLMRRRAISSNYFQLTALSDNCDFKLFGYGYVPTIELDVSLDNGRTWTTSTYKQASSVTSSTTAVSYTLASGINSGQSIMLRGDNSDFSLGANGGGTFYTNKANNWSFNATNSFSVSGNIMTLIDRTGKKSVVEKDYMFFCLFSGSTRIVDAKGLVIPATTLSYYSYGSMFYGCSKLQNAPLVIPDATVQRMCYRSMFENCVSLVESPHIQFKNNPMINISTSGAVFFYTFKGCSSLNKINVDFETWDSEKGSLIYQWVSNVASSGTFFKPKSLEEKYGINYIPSGWTVIDKE